MSVPAPCPCRSGLPFVDCHGDEGGKWETIKEIADVLRVDEDTVAAYASRDYDPLPLRVDHAQRRYITKRALASWVNRQDLPYGAWSELKKAHRLPGQRRREPTTGGRARPGHAVLAGRTKVAQRRRGGQSR